MHRKGLWPLIGLVGLLGLLSVPSGHAALLFNVTLDTSSLVGHPAGPFALDFLLLDGDGLANNTVTLSNFLFGGGSPAGVPVLTGGAAGDLASIVTLTDSTFFNDFTQQFEPGTFLSFEALLTTNGGVGGIPDSFAFSILDSTGLPLPTLDPLGTDALLRVDLVSDPLTVQSYGSDASRGPAGGGEALQMEAPRVVTVPEPGALLVMGTGLVGLLPLLRRRR